MIMRRVLKIVLAAAAMGLAIPAFAGPGLTDIESSYPCTLVYTGAAACQGYYGGNLSGANVADQQAALHELFTSPTTGTAVGGPAPTIDWNSVTKYSAGNLSGNILLFGTTLYGLVTLGMHFGNNTDPANPPENSTAFYLFDFGTTGSDHITFAPNANGF